MATANVASQGPPKASAEARHTFGFWSLLDQVLRQRESFFAEIFEGRNARLRLKQFLLATAVLTAAYGLVMGTMGMGVDLGRGVLQMISSAVKLPMLYLLSLAVCYPVLYFVIVLMGGRLGFLQVLSLILLALTLNGVLLASCAPIVLFFMVTGSDYDFIKLLHVAIFVFSGVWAMAALLQGLRAMCEKSDLYPRQAVRIMQIWVLVFGFVGSQMAWSLRPFVGSPDLAFQLFRQNRAGNLYQAAWQSAVNLTFGTKSDQPVAPESPANSQP